MIRSLFLAAYKYIKFTAFLPTVLILLGGIIMGIVDMITQMLLSNILGPVFALIIWIIVGATVSWVYLCTIALYYLVMDSIIKLEEIPKAINNLNLTLQTSVNKTIQSSSATNQQNTNVTSQRTSTSATYTQSQSQRSGLNIRR